MTGKIFRSIMIASAGVLLACTFIILGCLYEYFGNVQTDQLWAELDMAATGVETSGTGYLDALTTNDNRLTWIAADGSVLYDTQADPQKMGNHASRREVQQAMESGTGTSQRYSDTLFEKTIYCARRLSDNSVLRISIRHTTLPVLLFGMLQPICIVLLTALVLAFILASRLSKRIVEPLNNLDLDHPLENKTYDEIAPLLRRINQQRGQIKTQLQILQQKKNEFDQITASMNEGLVLLDDHGRILSINPAAEALFHTDSQSIGMDFLMIEHSSRINDAISLARKTGHSEISLDRDERIYQMDASRIECEDQILGTVLLIFDVTERVNAEQTRREFTANVSHELKTPLTTILGSSELLQTGMVKPEDTSRFLGHIHDEAARLLALIEDILRLSQLDEGVELPHETVELSAVAAEVAQQLQEKAQRYHTTLHLQTEPCPLPGVSRLFYEIIYNLTENAIKYNTEGGMVNISVTKDGIFTISDTGIGIPGADQERVFERFYRVDKSHSRQSGGTGLGLSIVKHAAAYLGAAIDLQSVVGEGTTIRVMFQKQESY